MKMEQVISKIKQYLTFNLEDVEYAIDVSQVREILELSTITKLVGSDNSMSGVINLRGGVVPVIDLRLKFNMTKTEKTIDTCIIVLEVMLNNENIVLGILADSVQEVVNLDSDNIEPPPRIGTAVDAEFIKGMGKRDGEFIILLDIDRIFTENELLNVENIKEEEAAN